NLSGSFHDLVSVNPGNGGLPASAFISNANPLLALNGAPTMALPATIWDLGAPATYWDPAGHYLNAYGMGTGAARSVAVLIPPATHGLWGVANESLWGLDD